MDSDTSRRSACDRCRGQKLRCVRLPGPAADDSPRSARPINQPCQRCKRAKVVCYTVGPVSQRVPQDHPQRRTTTYEDDVMQSEADMDEAMTRAMEPRQETTVGRTVGSSTDRLNHDPFPAESWLGLGLRHSSLSSAPALFHIPDSSAIVDSAAAQRGSNDVLPPSSDHYEWPDNSQDAFNYVGGSVHDMPDTMSVLSPNDVGLALDTISRRPATVTSRTNQNFQYDNRGGNIASRHKVNSSSMTLHESRENAHTQAHQPRGTNSHSLYSTASNSTPDTTQLYITQLSELNMRLIKDSERTTSFRQHLNEGSTPCSSSIMSEFTDSMLGNCQSFLDIIQRLKSSAVEVRKSGSSECSYDDLEYSSKEYSSSQSRSRNHSTSASNRSRDDRMPAGGGPPNILNSDTTGVPSSLDVAKADPSVLDFTAYLSILSCYTHILRAYDALFTRILGMLTESPCIQLDLKIPNLVPEVSLGGFRLDGHGDLQIKCLLHMRFIILGKIENMLGVNTPGSNSGLLNSSRLRGLLEALYCQKEFDYINADGTRAARVKKTMKSIQRILDSI